MMYERLRRELSYIQGLMEGNGINPNSTEQKVMQRLVDVVDELIETVQQMDLRQTELEEYVESIDEDLNEVELFVYDEDDDMLEITCPECGEEVFVDVEDLEDETVELLCPKCHTVLIEDDASDQAELKHLEENETPVSH